MELKQKISITGYRLLSILQFLIEEPASRDELLNFIDSREDLQKIGADTLRLDLNTLKSVGFDIKTKYTGNEYKYALNWNPISVHLTEAELKAFDGLKKALLEVCNWEYIVSLYELFKKISKYLSSKEHAERLLNFGYLLNVDFEILKALNEHCEKKEEIDIVYDSPSGNARELHVKCISIDYDRESKKLYLWCKNNQYEDLSYLRVEKITQIIKVHQENSIELPVAKKCLYKVYKHDGLYFSPLEKVLKIEKDVIEVEAEVLSEFYFAQRILSLGEHCFRVEDESIRALVLNKLLKMREIYGDMGAAK